MEIEISVFLTSVLYINPGDKCVFSGEPCMGVRGKLFRNVHRGHMYSKPFHATLAPLSNLIKRGKCIMAAQGVGAN